MPTLIPTSEDVRIYEIAVMYPASLDQKTESALLKSIDTLFAEAKATTIFKDPWSKRGLAYPIEGHTEAKYVIYYLEMDPKNVRELDEQLRLERGVLRHLIVLPPKGYEAVSYESRYQDWLKNRVTIEEMRRQKKEDKVKEQVAGNAKRAVKKSEEKKKSSPAMKMTDLTSELDKLISDEDLKM
jgi:small subunit ribosomal protein S6